MTRSGKLIRATNHEIGHHEYQDGLQAMWEDRWTLLGPSGQADWLQRHGVLPPNVCPLIVAPVHGTRRLLTGGQATPFGINLRRIRKAL